jgi:maleate isomerase
MKVSYGTRGIIGVINISSTVNLEPEFTAMAPEGVAVLTARVPLPRTTPEELMKLSINAKDAAKQLASAKPDIIVFACTSGSFINGAGYDKEVTSLLEEVSGGIPVITTSTALLAALGTLNIKRFSLATPYIEAVNVPAKRYFEDNGFAVVKQYGLGLDTDYAIGMQNEEQVAKLAHFVDCPEAQGVVLSCTNLKSISILERLEKELKKSVISANQATMWYALRKIGIDDEIKNAGQLMLLPCRL